MLYITILLFVFLFLISYYVEYRYGIMVDSLGGTKPLSKRGILDNMLWAGLKTFGYWFIFAILYVIICVILWGLTDLDFYFYAEHTTTIDCIVLLFMTWVIWKLRLKKLAQRMAEYDLFYTVKRSRAMLICCILLVSVPYLVMSNFGEPIFQLEDVTIKPKQYSGNDTIFSQILQEVANTDGHILSTKASIQEDFRNLYRDLRNILVAGITISTFLLGLIIMYFTRNHDVQKLTSIDKNNESYTDATRDN